MIDLEFLERLIRSMDESALDNLEIERGGTRIRLSKSPAGGTVAAPSQGLPPAPAAAPAPAPAPAPGNPGSTGSAAEPAEAPPADENWVQITSPMVGTFYRSPSPEASPFTEVGETISMGQTLCIIEAMKLMNELEAEVEGTVREILVENGEPVEYGQVLFRVEPS